MYGKILDNLPPDAAGKLSRAAGNETSFGEDDPKGFTEAI
jgi:hypothetical protein